MRAHYAPISLYLDALPKTVNCHGSMSLRKDDSDAGNQITMILANLGTHLADPLESDIIHRSVQNAKDRFCPYDSK